MKPDRFPVFTATAAAAITSASARLIKLDRRVKIAISAATGAALFCVALAAGDKSSGGQSEDVGAAYSEARGVDWGVFPPEGFKGTTHSVSAARFTSGSGGFAEDSSSVMETLSVKNGEATFKTNTSTESSFWGNAYPNPNADHSKRRLCIQKIDRRGKVLSSEGDDPDGYDGAVYPDHRVKVGETWTAELSGRGTNAGSNYTIISTVKEVVSIKGRQMAVITFTARGNQVRNTGTQWFDIQTGLVVRETTTGSGTTADGWDAIIKYNAWFTDFQGERWVD